MKYLTEIFIFILFVDVLSDLDFKLTGLILKAWSKMYVESEMLFIRFDNTQLQVCLILESSS